MVTTARKNEITAQGQELCAKWYENARSAAEAGDAELACYWQCSAASHMVKVQHRMGTLKATMDSCVLQQRKMAFLEAQSKAQELGIKMQQAGNFEQVWL